MNKKKILKHFKRYNASYIAFGLAFVLIMFFFELYSDLTYTPSTFRYTWNGILMFMSVCAGLGWVIHGTGFLLVKVSK